MSSPTITLAQWRTLLDRETMIRDPRADGWQTVRELASTIGLHRESTRRKLETMAAMGRVETRWTFDPQTRRWCRFYRPPAKPKV